MDERGRRREVAQSPRAVGGELCEGRGELGVDLDCSVAVGSNWQVPRGPDLCVFVLHMAQGRAPCKLAHEEQGGLARHGGLSPRPSQTHGS